MKPNQDRIKKLRGIAAMVKRQYIGIMHCYICKESRTVEMCHVIAISEGGSSDMHNLIGLCPNHHYLYDHNKLNEAEYSIIKDRVEIAKRYFELNSGIE